MIEYPGHFGFVPLERDQDPTARAFMVTGRGYLDRDRATLRIIGRFARVELPRWRAEIELGPDEPRVYAIRAWSIPVVTPSSPDVVYQAALRAHVYRVDGLHSIAAELDFVRLVERP